MPDLLNSRQALDYLDIEKKAFENYLKNSKEIKAVKNNGWWWFNNEFE